jgi:hypothetical protein
VRRIRGCGYVVDYSGFAGSAGKAVDRESARMYLETGRKLVRRFTGRFLGEPESLM